MKYTPRTRPAPRTVTPRYSCSMLAPSGSVGDVRGRWPAIFDMNVTQYALELAGSAIHSGHREHTTNHAAASIAMDQPTLVVATTSAATSPGLASPLLNVDELSIQARSLVRYYAHTRVEVSEDCARVDDVARKERVEDVDSNSSSCSTNVIACHRKAAQPSRELSRTILPGSSIVRNSGDQLDAAPLTK